MGQMRDESDVRTRGDVRFRGRCALNVACGATASALAMTRDPDSPISLLVTATPDPKVLPVGSVLSVRQLAALFEDAEKIENAISTASSLECGALRVEVIHDDPDQYDDLKRE
jgi:hypothetical protein